MNTQKHSKAALLTAADKINAFAAPFTLGGEEPLLLAGVLAATIDEPNKETALLVDIEFFRSHGKTYTAQGRHELAVTNQAESDIIDFCKRLGFDVKFESNTGSGTYGQINSLYLT